MEEVDQTSASQRIAQYNYELVFGTSFIFYTRKLTQARKNPEREEGDIYLNVGAMDKIIIENILFSLMTSNWKYQTHSVNGKNKVDESTVYFLLKSIP